MGLRSTSPIRPRSRSWTSFAPGRPDADGAGDRPDRGPYPGFPKKFDETKLQEAFVSPCTAKCMKAIWDRRSILLCVQNEKTQSNDEAMKGAKAFKNDPKYTKGIEIIMLDPADKAEQGFLKELQVDPRTPQGRHGPGDAARRPVARFTGALTKDQIETAVTKAKSSCGPGCNCHH